MSPPSPMRKVKSYAPRRTGVQPTHCLRNSDLPFWKKTVRSASASGEMCTTNPVTRRGLKRGLAATRCHSMKQLITRWTKASKSP